MFRPIVAAAILVAICLSCIGEQDVVKMGTEGAYPPYNIINDDGEVDGFERELGGRAVPESQPRMRLGDQ